MWTVIQAFRYKSPYTILFEMRVLERLNTAAPSLLELRFAQLGTTTTTQW